MLRNLNTTRDGRRVCGTPQVGILGSLIPSTGSNGPALAYNDVIQDSLQSNLVRIWIKDHNFPYLFVYEDTSWIAQGIGGAAIPDGTYVAHGVLIVDDVDQNPNTDVVLTLTVGTGVAITAAATLQVGTRPSISVAVGMSMYAQAILAISGAPLLTAAVGIDVPETVNVTATLDLTTTPSLSVSVLSGHGLPSTIAPSRTFVVDLDNATNHAEAVFLKDPQATLDYGVDCTAWLQDAQDSIALFSITTLTGSTVIIDTVGLVSGVMAALVKGGTPGVVEGLLFAFTTMGGRYDERTIFLQVQDR